MVVEDFSLCGENGGPAAGPAAPAGVEVLDVGGFEGFAERTGGAEFAGVVERAAAAAVGDVGQILTVERGFAADGKSCGSPEG